MDSATTEIMCVMREKQRDACGALPTCHTLKLASSLDTPGHAEWEQPPTRRAERRTDYNAAVGLALYASSIAAVNAAAADAAAHGASLASHDDLLVLNRVRHVVQARASRKHVSRVRPQSII